MYSPLTFYPCSLKPAHEYSLFQITLNFTNQNLCWSHITSLHKIRWLTKFKEFWGAVWPLKIKTCYLTRTNLKYYTCTLVIHKLYYVTLLPYIRSGVISLILFHSVTVSVHYIFSLIEEEHPYLGNAFPAETQTMKFRDFKIIFSSGLEICCGALL